MKKIVIGLMFLVLSGCSIPKDNWTHVKTEKVEFKNISMNHPNSYIVFARNGNKIDVRYLETNTFQSKINVFVDAKDKEMMWAEVRTYTTPTPMMTAHKKEIDIHIRSEDDLLAKRLINAN